MKLPHFVLLLMLSVLSCNRFSTQESISVPRELNHNLVLNKIAFGSCNKSKNTGEIWPAITEKDPDLWIWTGDIIYGDTENMGVLKKKYDAQYFHPDYQNFISKVPVLGIWDDHDYGVNDGGHEYPRKKESRDLLFEFLNVSKDQPAWKREGAYQSYTIGPTGQQVKIILLDARYFREELQDDLRPNNRYLPNHDGIILGEDQWNWLKNELSHSQAQAHIIASGIQVIPDEQGYEKWANFPKARKMILEMIADIKPANTLLISGDRHMAEFSQISFDSYLITEVTSSGMSHTWRDTSAREKNAYRIGPQIVRRNFGTLDINWNDTPFYKINIWGKEGEMLLTEEI